MSNKTMFGAFSTFRIGDNATRTEAAHIQGQRLAETRKLLQVSEAAKSRAERQLSELRERMADFDDILPAMLAYVDPNLTVRHANRAFASRAMFHAVTGRHLSEVLPNDVFSTVEESFKEALAGRVVSYERQRHALDGLPSRVVFNLLPDFDSEGHVKGLFLVGTDLGPVETLVTNQKIPEGLLRRSIYERTVTEDPHTWRNVIDRLRAAIENEEFNLLAQPLAPMRNGLEPMRDVMVRMKEEEDNRLPPGTYLPIAEENGLLPTLDRWAMRRLIQWLGKDMARRKAIYAVNIAGCTLAEPDIVRFIRGELADAQVPGRCLLLRITEADAIGLAPGARDAMGLLQEHGVRFELAGFGCTPEGFPLLESLPFDFVTIEAGLAISATRDRRGAIKVRAINDAVHRTGARTIAGPMESREAVDRMKSLGVDYAQGPAIAPLRPINELKAG